MPKAINYFRKKLLLRYLIGFSRFIYLFKVSATTSGRGSYKHFFWLNCLENKQVNAGWLVINDLEKILFSVSV